MRTRRNMLRASYVLIFLLALSWPSLWASASETRQMAQAVEESSSDKPLSVLRLDNPFMDQVERRRMHMQIDRAQWKTEIYRREIEPRLQQFFGALQARALISD